MPNRFRKQIRKALQDVHLQTALDGNAERRMNVRKQSFAGLPDYEERRRRAHALRAEVIGRLDFYLETFVAQARQNGLIIHRAADAEQAVQAVLDIARQHQAKRIAKSKSMLSEEIKLNRHLEAAGLEVVETDLGEYIVQLRGEPPAHIITPAVHLRREDVAELFHEKLGMPLTDDIKVMTDLARHTLRDVFLNAQIGISGVNLAVAETGTICVLTNEGNGRMVTTLPPVHISLMGMERIVPRLDDLALILSLLPRSATGQKITVYANLLHGPRRQEDADGPAERHLILLDNGRSRLRQSPLAEALYCIRCGACLNACPVFREIGGHSYINNRGAVSAYPGPIGSVISPFLFGLKEFGHLARASSLCGACREVCPVNIDLPKLLLRIRAGHMESPHDGSTGTGMINPPQSPFTKGEKENPPRSPFEKGEEGKTPFHSLAPLKMIAPSCPPLEKESILVSPLKKESLLVPPLKKGGRGDLPNESPLTDKKNNKTKTSDSNAPGYLKVGLKFYAWISFKASRFQRAQQILSLLSRLFVPFSDWMHLPRFTRWGFSKDFPRPPKRSFRTRFPMMTHSAFDENILSAPRNTGTCSARVIPLLETDSLPARFNKELIALEGKLVLCAEKELSTRITALLQARGIQELAAWDRQYLPDGLIETLQVNGLQILDRPQPTTRAGLTGVLAAVAETGTLVIPGGSGRPLSVSLLPDLHIAVLREADIRERLEDVFQLADIRNTAAVVLVSGPSRTADIEMTLTIGVHGPAEVHVFCYSV